MFPPNSPHNPPALVVPITDFTSAIIGAVLELNEILVLVYQMSMLEELQLLEKQEVL